MLKGRKGRFKKGLAMVVAAGIVLNSLQAVYADTYQYQPATYGSAIDTTVAGAQPNATMLQSLTRFGGSGTQKINAIVTSIIPANDGGYLADINSNSTNHDYASFNGVGNNASSSLVKIETDSKGNPTSETVLQRYGSASSIASSDSSYYSLSMTTIVPNANKTGYYFCGTKTGEADPAGADGVDLRPFYSSSTSTTPSSGTDALIGEMDNNGNILWMRNFGGGGTDYFFSASRTNDGGLLAVGITSSTDNDMAEDGAFGTSLLKGTSDLVLVKYDSSHNVQWKKNYNSPNTQVNMARTVSLGNDSFYVYATVTQNNSSPDFSAGDFSTTSNGGLAINGWQTPDMNESETIHCKVTVSASGLTFDSGFQFSSREITKIVPTTDGDYIAISTMPSDPTLYGDGNGGTNGYSAIAKLNSSVDVDYPIWSKYVYGDNAGNIESNSGSGGTQATAPGTITYTNIVQTQSGYIAIGSCYQFLNYAQGTATINMSNGAITSFTDDGSIQDISYLNSGYTGTTPLTQAQISGTGADYTGTYLYGIAATSDGGALVLAQSTASTFHTQTQNVPTEGATLRQLTYAGPSFGLPTKYGTKDVLIAKFSAPTDYDGDGVPNDRDYYPYDSTKSVPDSSLNLLDATKAAVSTVAGTANSDGSATASISEDALNGGYTPSGASAASAYQFSDNVAFSDGSVTANVPVTVIDNYLKSASGTTFALTGGSVSSSTDKTSLYYKSVTNGLETKMGKTFSYVAPFQLSVGAATLQTLGSSIQVQVNLGNTSGIDTSAAKLYTYSVSGVNANTSSQIPVTFGTEASGNTVATFKTNLLDSAADQSVYAFVQPGSTVDADTTGGDIATVSDKSDLAATGNLTFNLADATIVFPASDIQNNSDITGGFSVSASENSGAVSTTQALTDASVKIADAFNLSITPSGSTTSLHTLGGDATVTLNLSAFTLATLKGSGTPVLYYYNTSSNAIEPISGATFDLTAGTVTFQTPHFSTYAVGLKATPVSSVTSPTDSLATAKSLLATSGTLSFTLADATISTDASTIQNDPAIPDSFTLTAASDSASAAAAQNSLTANYTVGGAFTLGISPLSSSNNGAATVTEKLSSDELSVLKGNGTPLLYQYTGGKLTAVSGATFALTNGTVTFPATAQLGTFVTALRATPQTSFTSSSDSITTNKYLLPGADSSNSTANVTFGLADATITLPSGSITGNSAITEDFTFSTGNDSDATASAKKLAASNAKIVDAFDLNLTAAGASESIHDLGASATVVRKLTDAEIAALRNGTATLYYYDPSGALDLINGAQFDLGAKTVTFTTPHFSAYVLAYTVTSGDNGNGGSGDSGSTSSDETPVSSAPVSSTIPSETSSTTSNPDTGYGSDKSGGAAPLPWLPLISALSAIAAACVAFRRRTGKRS
ncbi:MAG: hypothetical protein ABF449_05470 [Ethanoligenens sp.]